MLQECRDINMGRTGLWLQQISARSILEAAGRRYNPHNSSTERLEHFGDYHDPRQKIWHQVQHIGLEAEGHNRACYDEGHGQDRCKKSQPPLTVKLLS